MSVLVCKMLTRTSPFLAEAGLDPAAYCTCGNCTKKPSLDESVCCQSKKQTKQGGGGGFIDSYIVILS